MNNCEFINKVEDIIAEQTRNGRENIYIDRDIMAQLTDNKDFTHFTSKKVDISLNVIQDYIVEYKKKNNIK